MNDSVAVALILGAHRAFLDGYGSAASILALRGKRRKVPLLYFVSRRFIIAFFRQYTHPLDITGKFSNLQAFSGLIGKESYVFYKFLLFYRKKRVRGRAFGLILLFLRHRFFHRISGVSRGDVYTRRALERAEKRVGIDFAHKRATAAEQQIHAAVVQPQRPGKRKRHRGTQP